MKSKIPFLRSCLPVVLILLFAAPGLACPTCKQALAEAGNNPDLVRGYFWSILFMMSMPFAILGGMSALFYVLVRRARAASKHTNSTRPETNVW